MPTAMVGVGSNLKSQSFLSHPHRGVGLLGHGQISFVSFKGVRTLGTTALLGVRFKGYCAQFKSTARTSPYQGANQCQVNMKT